MRIGDFEFRRIDKSTSSAVGYFGTDDTVMIPDEENGVYEYLVDVEVCKETATNEYECEGDSISYDDFDEDDVGQTNIKTETAHGIPTLFPRLAASRGIPPVAHPARRIPAREAENKQLQASEKARG